MLAFTLLASFIWGCLVAAFIHFTELGRFISLRLTWLIVAIGVGGDLLLMLGLTDSEWRIVWWHLVAVIAVSSITLSTRGILELAAYFRSMMDDARDTAGE